MKPPVILHEGLSLKPFLFGKLASHIFSFLFPEKLEACLCLLGIGFWIRFLFPGWTSSAVSQILASPTGFQQDSARLQGVRVCSGSGPESGLVSTWMTEKSRTSILLRTRPDSGRLFSKPSLHPSSVTKVGTRK